MKNVADSHTQRQEKVNAYFQSWSSYWENAYSIRGVQAEVIRGRHVAVLDWVDTLALAPGSRVLEVGCGAGFMAIALAQRELRVHAIDSAEAMIELAGQHSTEAGTTDLLSLDVGDVYSLAFEDESLDLVIAIGVIPWLTRADLAIQEMARVTKPGGYVIITTANPIGLASLLDPIVSPALIPLKRPILRALEQAGLSHRPPSMIFHHNRSIDETLARNKLIKVRGMTHGFAFSLLRHSFIPEPLGTKIHHRLQRLADKNAPLFRSGGMTYLVLARKSAS